MRWRLPPWLGLAAFFAVAFAVAHTQAPLYYSNQHQYFLHGLAEGGAGNLHEDWLANTADPTPLFSAVAAVAYRGLGEWVFQAAYFALLCLYFLSLAAVPAALSGPPLTPLARWGYWTLLIAVHAAIFRVASVRLFGVDYPWYFQSGVASQYALGPGLQPSALGVLLITSIVAFAHDKPGWAIACCCLAACGHPTYLPTAGLLTATYLVCLTRAGRWRWAVGLGAAALVAVLPVTIMSLVNFRPTTPEQFAEAQEILADFRIPHHTDVSLWLDGIAAAQVAWIAAALWLARGTKIFAPLGVLSAAGLLFSVIQAVTRNHTLALLFPWRVTIVLVPLATAILLARATNVGCSWLEKREASKRGLAAACACIVAGSVIGGVVVVRQRWGYQVDDSELPLLEYVREQHRPGEVYLLPVRVPALGSASRGSVSNTFVPPRKAEKGKMIPVDLQRFRLTTAAPIYVDFKAIPYRDVDVLEWRRRIQQTADWYKKADWGNPRTKAAIAQTGITHLVIAGKLPESTGLGEPVYSDERYSVYRIARSNLPGRR